MFTVCPSSGGGIIQVARPSASSGTIINPTLAYDLPSGRADDPPYSTYADSGSVSGSAVAGTPDFRTLQWDTFPSRAKTNFTNCELKIGLVYSYSAMQTFEATGGGHVISNYVIPSLQVQYQIDGSTWSTLQNIYVPFGETTIGPAADGSGGTDTFVTGYLSVIGSGAGSIYGWNAGITTLSKNIAATAFPTNLNSLKVRFILGSCTSVIGSGNYKSSYQLSVYDIRANIS